MLVTVCKQPIAMEKCVVVVVVVALACVKLVTGGLWYQKPPSGCSGR